jgi:SAM-dependent methyltransferase
MTFRPTPYERVDIVGFSIISPSTTTPPGNARSSKITLLNSLFGRYNYTRIRCMLPARRCRVHTAGDRQAFLSETLRVLKPGGKLLIDTMCRPVVSNKLAGYDPKTKSVLHDGIATRYFGLPAEVEKEVEKQDFD